LRWQREKQGTFEERKKKMTLQEYKKKKMQDPEFAKAY